MTPTSAVTPTPAATSTPVRLPFVLGGATVVNASGYDQAGVWTTPSLSWSANTGLKLRLFSGGASLAGCLVAASGIAFVGAGGSTPETGLVVDHASGVWRGGYLEFALAVGVTQVAPGGSDVIVAAGTVTCAGVPNAAVAAPLPGGSAFAGAIAVGATLSAQIMWNGALNIVSGVLGFDGSVEPGLGPTPFNGVASGATPIVLAVTDPAQSQNMQTVWPSSNIGDFVDLPPAFSAAGVTWSADTSIFGSIMWTADAVGWGQLAHGIYDLTVRPGAIGADGIGPRFGGVRLRIIYGTTLQAGNAAALWAPAAQRAATTASNASVLTLVTNATLLGLAVFSGASSVFNAGLSLASLYPTLHALVDGGVPRRGADVSAALRELAAPWSTGANSVTMPLASDNFTLHAMLGEGTYLLERAPLAAFPATQDYWGVADPHNPDVLFIIDRTLPTPANATYAGAAQAVGAPGNFLLPQTLCSDAVSSDASLITLVATRFLGGDGQGYACAAPVPLSGAYCRAPIVRGPPQSLLIEVACADEAGNVAVAFATVPIVAAGEGTARTTHRARVRQR